MDLYQTLISFGGTFVSGLIAAYLYMRHVIGYLHPWEAQVLADIAHLKAMLNPPAPKPSPVPAAAPPPPAAPLEPVGAPAPVTKPS